MDNSRTTGLPPATFFKTIRIIHSALIIGSLLFGVVSFFITPDAALNLQAKGDIIFYMVPLFVISGLLVGTRVYKRKLADITGAMPLPEKLSNYRAALINRYAIYNGTTMFAIVAFFLGGNLYYLVIAAIDICCLIAVRPTKQKIEEDLGLDLDEKTQLGF